MATATPHLPATTTLTLDEYLRSIYHPDCDFVDGHLEEQNVGGTKHGLLQMQLGYCLPLPIYLDLPELFATLD